MDIDHSYLECKLEEYRRCKEEIVILQKYQWRVQFFYIPTLLLTLIAFYLNTVWKSDGSQVIEFSAVIEDLFSDGSFVTIILWSALLAILVVLFTGNRVMREGRYIRLRLSPVLNTLLKRDDVFEWERICTERRSISIAVDDSIQMYGDSILGTFLLFLPIAVGTFCLVQGLRLLKGMSWLIFSAYWVGVVISLLLLVMSILSLVNCRLRHNRETEPEQERTD